MGTLKYRLRRSTKEDGGSVELDFNYGINNRIRQKTGITLSKAKHWNKKQQRVSISSDVPNHSKFNNFLRKLADLIQESYEMSLIEKEPFNKKTVNEILNKFNDFIFKSDLTKETSTFLKLFDKYRLNLKESQIKGSRKVKRQTAQSIYNKLTKTLLYIQTNDPDLSFKEIDDELYLNLMSHFRNQGYAENYIGKLISDFKSFCKYLKEKKRIDLPNYHDSTWLAPREDVESIYLTLEEIELIESVDLSSQKPIYRNVRDLFLIGCKTGLRVSDYNRLSENNIITKKGVDYFSIRDQKTDNDLIIPISNKVQEIIIKNNGLPHQLPEQTINKTIKHIGKLAGINEKIIIRKTLGGKKKEIQFKKHELIVTHTARRSFCTNAYLEGLGTFEIMAISGHKTEKMFMKYIKVTKQQYAERIAEHKYFKMI